MEVSRTKLRQLGIDWAKLTGDDFVIQSAAGLINAAATQAGTISGTGDSMRFGIVSPGGTFGALIDVLKQNSLAKILAEPTLVTISGRPARFVVGGEIPIAVSGGLGVTTVEFREFGTIIDFVPIVKGNGRIHLEVRPHITEIDPSLRDPVTGTPGFRTRSVDTAVEMMSGQTLALAGLIQTRVESENKGIPWLSDLPWIGAAFRRVQESVNEVELLIMVTPEIIAPLDPHEVPPFGPGGFTTSPSDFDLFVKGYMEVPKCCLDRNCPQCRRGLSMIGPTGSDRRFESLPPGQQTLPQSNPTLPPSARPRPRLNPSILEQTQNRTRFDGRHQFAYPQTYPSTAAPQTQYGTMRQNPYNWSTPTVPLTEKRNTPSEAEPTLIGPIGYDVLN